MAKSHKAQIIALLFNELNDRGYLFRPLLANQPEADCIKKDIEDLADVILSFFSEADSYSEKWSFHKPSDLMAKIDWLPAANFRAIADEAEHRATESARLGDKGDLAKLLLERGYLRTSAARKLVADNLKGMPKKDGPIPSGIHEERWRDVVGLVISSKVNWAEAQRRYCAEIQLNEGTLKKSLEGFEKANPGMVPLRKLMVKKFKGT